MTSSKRASSAAFTLVEVTLALMVVAVGALAVLGVFPSALKAGKKAVDEARIAAFSEEVFNSFRAKYGDAKTTPWTEAETTLSGDLPDAICKDNLTSYGGAQTYRVSVPSSKLATSLKYEYDFGRLGTYVNYEYGLRYRLNVGATAANDSRYMRLVVWPGEHGETTDPQEADGYVFYTEFHRLEL